jgi:hypothetical protein
MGIDIGKNSFHVVSLDRRGAIVLRQKCSRGQIEARPAATAEVPDRVPKARRSFHPKLSALAPNQSIRCVLSDNLRNLRPCKRLYRVDG